MRRRTCTEENLTEKAATKMTSYTDVRNTVLTYCAELQCEPSVVLYEVIPVFCGRRVEIARKVKGTINDIEAKFVDNGDEADPLQNAFVEWVVQQRRNLNTIFNAFPASTLSEDATIVIIGTWTPESVFVIHTVRIDAPSNIEQYLATHVTDRYITEYINGSLEYIGSFQRWVTDVVFNYEELSVEILKQAPLEAYITRDGIALSLAGLEWSPVQRDPEVGTIVTRGMRFTQNI